MNTEVKAMKSATICLPFIQVTLHSNLADGSLTKFSQLPDVSFQVTGAKTGRKYPLFAYVSEGKESIADYDFSNMVHLLSEAILSAISDNELMVGKCGAPSEDIQFLSPNEASTWVGNVPNASYRALSDEERLSNQKKNWMSSSGYGGQVAGSMLNKISNKYRISNNDADRGLATFTLDSKSNPTATIRWESADVFVLVRKFSPLEVRPTERQRRGFPYRGDLQYSENGMKEQYGILLDLTLEALFTFPSYEAATWFTHAALTDIVHDTLNSSIDKLNSTFFSDRT